MASVPNVLSGVSCTSKTFCAATGVWSNGYGSPTKTLIETWNGSAWSLATTPSSGTHTNSLDSISCTGTKYCVAAGSDSGGLTENTLVEVWTGTKWSAVSSPDPGVSQSVLFADSCTTTITCQAVGEVRFPPESGQFLMRLAAEDGS